MNKLIWAAVMILSAGVAQAGDTGKQIFDSKCAACHTTGAAGAPKLGDKAAWAPRIEAGESVLVASLLQGKNAMPPKGACGDCSEADLMAAMDYLLSQSQ